MSKKCRLPLHPAKQAKFESGAFIPQEIAITMHTTLRTMNQDDVGTLPPKEIICQLDAIIGEECVGSVGRSDRGGNGCLLRLRLSDAAASHNLGEDLVAPNDLAVCPSSVPSARRFSRVRGARTSPPATSASLAQTPAAAQPAASRGLGESPAGAQASRRPSCGRRPPDGSPPAPGRILVRSRSPQEAKLDLQELCLL